jgi:hypothetical protein
MKGSLGSDIKYIWVARMNLNSRDVLGLFQTQFFPGFASIGGFVYPVAVGGHDSSRRMFTHSHIDDVGIAFGYRHRTY